MKRSLRGISHLLVLATSLGWIGCSQSQSDEMISNALKARFYSEPQLKDESIEILVANGEVTLQGDLSSQDSHLTAYKLASDTAGVQKINDQLTVKGKPPADRQSQSRTPARAQDKTSPQGSYDRDFSRQPASSNTASVQPPPQDKRVTIPAGTQLRIRMVDAVDSATHQAGQIFLSSLDSPVVVGNEVVLPRGIDVQVKLLEVESSGKLRGRSKLVLGLDSLSLGGEAYSLVSDIHQQEGASRGKDTVKKVGIGAAIGTAVGAIAGGKKGAAIGGGVGAGSGTAMQVLTEGKQVQIPSETKLDFVLEQPLEVRVR